MIYNALQHCLEGDVHHDLFRRHLLATDGSIFNCLPACVTYPRNSRDVVKIMSFANSHGIPVHSRGAGSGVCGASLGNGIVVDFTRYMNGLIKLDIENRYFECRPGYRMGELELALKGTGLFFPPDPSSGEYASFGGMFATNASGAHSAKYGNVGDYCLDADIVTATGEKITLSHILSQAPADLSPPLKALYELYQTHARQIEAAYPPVRYNTTGYNLRGLVKDDRLDLRHLFAGSEGTLGVVTRLKFRLLPRPGHDSLVVAYFNDIVSSAKAVEKILPMVPCGIEVMDKSLLSLARENDPILDAAIPHDIDNLLLIGFDESSPDLCMEKAERVGQLLKENNYSHQFHIAVSPEEQAKFWAIRKAAVPILYRLKGEKKVLALIEDATVPTHRLVEYFQGLYKILNTLGVRFVLFGHIAKGLMHTRPLLNLKDKTDVERLKPIADAVFQLVNSLGGAISGEHGDGRLRSPYIRAQYPDIYPLFVETKKILDPGNLFNPDIITGACHDLMTRNLRYGIAYRAHDLYKESLFSGNEFINEVEKCHGCSKCTTVTTATRMCPVYKFTRDEAAAPKAKANILRALISGAIEEKQAFSQGIFHVLNHCINCGSCHSECPSGVNIPRMVIAAKSAATSKFGTGFTNELLTSLEPVARGMGRLSPLLLPLMEMPVMRQMGEKITGISSKRTMISLAPKSLETLIGSWAQEKQKPYDLQPSHLRYQGTIPCSENKKPAASHRPRVLFFAGCYAGYVRPEVGLACIKTLRAMGMTVLVPKQHCCGLPMHSKGMTRKAQTTIKKNLRQWEPALDGVDHIVVTCSSCGLALKNEWASLVNLPAVHKVADKTIHISQLILTNLHRLPLEEEHHLKIAYHTPCHLKVQDNAACSIDLLSAIPGMAVDALTSHCCGMAGTWGMMADHYDLSKKIGSDLALRLEHSPGTMGVTDCPTCTLQMEAFSPKPVCHPVEIVAGLLKHL